MIKLKLRYWLPAVGAALLLSLPSCSKPAEEVAPPPVQQAAAEKPATVQPVALKKELAVEAPTLTTAMVTFLSGDVEITVEEEWISANVGDLIKQGDSVTVGDDSYCEIQFGNKASIRVQANTTLQLEEKYFSPSEARVTARVASGAVLCKVKKLLNNESFNVSTASATCGVRGTETLVRVDEEHQMKVAVAEGKVAVSSVPRAITVARDKLKAKDAILIAAIGKIEQAEVLVESGQEVNIDKATAEQNEKAYKPLEEAIQAILKEDSSEAVSQEKVEEITVLLKEANTQIATRRNEPDTLTEESAEELQEISQITDVEIPPEVMQKLEKLEEAPKEEQKLEEHEFYRVIIRTEPADAQVFLDGMPVGQGGFSGIYTKAVRLTFQIKKDGFEDQEFALQTKESSGQERLVTLDKSLEQAKPEPPSKEKIVVSVTPFDAEVYLGGKRVGRGRFSREFDIGQSLSFNAKREGYWDEKLYIEVKKGSGRTYALALKEKPKEAVVVRATPSDAEIYLDGSRVGQGQFSREYQLGQSLSVTVKKEGYFDETLKIDVVEGSGRTYTVSLREKPKPKESIVVRTTPLEAEIYLEGSRVGRGRLSRDIEVGQSFSVTVKKEGYFDETLKIDVVEGSGRTYTVSLREKPKPKESIVVRTTPLEAEIYLEGSRVGRGRLSRDIEVGQSFSVTVKKEGYFDETLKIDVVEGSGRTYTVSLKEKPKPKEKIIISTTPGDAEITINGTNVGRGSVSGQYEVGKSLRVVARKDGYKPQNLQISVSQGGGRTYELALQAIYASLILENRGESGNYDVYVDGTKTGTNLAKVDKLAAGFHKIEIKQERMLGLETIHSQGLTISKEGTIPVVFSIPDVLVKEQAKLDEIKAFIKESFDKREQKEKVEEKFEEALDMLEETQFSETLQAEKEKLEELQAEYKKKWIFW